jgi:hypothetical protein
MLSTGGVLVLLAIFVLAGVLLAVPRLFRGRGDDHDARPPGSDER